MRESIKKYSKSHSSRPHREKNENHKNFFRSLILVNCYHFLISLFLLALFAVL